MKPAKTLIILLFCCCSLFGQQRGVVPIPKPWGDGTTRALVVGISNYENGLITDLRFADKDAEAFAEFLQSPTGGMLQDSQLVLLTDEQATGGRIIAGFDWLIEKSEENDIAIIYFAGHGDVETNRYNPWGYLLPYDSPARSYSLGAISIRNLQESIIPTLSAMKKARVILISDACHAGQLAGTSVGGAQITAKKMLEQFDNEIKILSCQPNEVSSEGEQWGGGHGAFSYHLIEGLKGEANTDGDSTIRLLEIERYLGDIVPREVAPMRQVPLAIGDKYAPVLFIPSGKRPKLTVAITTTPEFSSLKERSGASVLLQLDSSVQKLYNNFEAALSAKRFFEPKGTCAEDLFEKLIQIPELSEFHGKMKRNFAAALQEDAQKVLNGILSLDHSQLSMKSNIKKFETYKPYPRQLGKAAELLGKSHYFYNTLKARQIFFEGTLLLYGQAASKEQKQWQPIIDKFKESLEYDPASPATYYYLEKCWFINAQIPDSAVYYANKAEIYDPNWILPKAFLAYKFSEKKFKDLAKAKTYLDRIMEIDSSSEYFWFYFAQYQLAKNDLKGAEHSLTKALKINDKNPTSWLNIGIINYAKKDYQKAEFAIKKSIELDSVQVPAFYRLGQVYEKQKQVENAEKMYLQALKYSPNSTTIRRKLGILYINDNRLKDAESVFKNSLKMDPTDEMTAYQMTVLYCAKNQKRKALKNLKKALKNGYKYKDWIMEDPNLEKIRDLKKFKNIMEQYFPKTE